MKKRYVILAAAALAMILSSSVSDASAYFTTYVSGRGEKEVVLKDRTTIDETFSNFMKSVTITADADSEPVFVRARAFAPAEFGVLYVDDSGKWSFGSDGWCYYEDPISKGGSAETFNVKIGTLTPNASEMDLSGLSVFGREPAEGTLYNIPGSGKDGDNFNVVVVYEYTPVLFDDDGNAYADWTKKAEPKDGDTSGGSGDSEGTGGNNG